MTQLELLRQNVTLAKIRCREAFAVPGVHPQDIIYRCWNYHREVQDLRDAEARLALLERGAA